MSGTSNKTDRELIEQLIRQLEEFQEQYNLDARGDNKVNGEIGFIGEIREIKKHQDKYPSLTYLFSVKPLLVITVGVAVWMLLWAITTVGLMKLVLAFLGLPIPG